MPPVFSSTSTPELILPLNHSDSSAEDDDAVLRDVDREDSEIYTIAAHVQLKASVSPAAAKEAARVMRISIKNNLDAMILPTLIGQMRITIWDSYLVDEGSAEPTRTEMETGTDNETSSPSSTRHVSTLSQSSTMLPTSSTPEPTAASTATPVQGVTTEPENTSSVLLSVSSSPLVNPVDVVEAVCQDSANFCEGWNAESCASIAPVSAKLTIVKSCAATCNQCTTLPNLVCEDDSTFVDVIGRTCADWKVHNCFNAQNVAGYSATAKNALFAACPSSCLACQDCARRQLVGSDLLHCRTSEGPSIEAQQDACSDNLAFRDVHGNSCKAWEGVQCKVYPGYAPADMDDIKEQCKQTCGLCSDAGSIGSITTGGIAEGNTIRILHEDPVLIASNPTKMKYVWLVIALSVAALIFVLGFVLVKKRDKRSPEVAGIKDGVGERRGSFRMDDRRLGSIERFSHLNQEWDNEGFGDEISKTSHVPDRNQDRRKQPHRDQRRRHGTNINMNVTHLDVVESEHSAAQSNASGLRTLITQYERPTKLLAKDDQQAIAALRGKMSEHVGSGADLRPLEQFMVDYLKERAHQSKTSNQEASEAAASESAAHAAAAAREAEVEGDYDLAFRSTLHMAPERAAAEQPPSESLVDGDQELFRTTRIRFANPDAPVDNELGSPSANLFGTRRAPQQSSRDSVVSAADSASSDRLHSPANSNEVTLRSQQIFKSAKLALRASSSASSQGYPISHGPPGEANVAAPGYCLSAAGRYAFEADAYEEEQRKGSNFQPADGLLGGGYGLLGGDSYEGEGEPVYATAIARSRSVASSEQSHSSHLYSTADSPSRTPSHSSHVYSTAHGPDSIRGSNHLYAKAHAPRVPNGGNHVYAKAHAPRKPNGGNHLYSTANHGVRSPPLPAARNANHAC